MPASSLVIICLGRSAGLCVTSLGPCPGLSLRLVFPAPHIGFQSRLQPLFADHCGTKVVVRPGFARHGRLCSATPGKRPVPLPISSCAERTLRLITRHASFGIAQNLTRRCGSSVVEHTLGKGEVESSILSHSTILAPGNQTEIQLRLLIFGIFQYARLGRITFHGVFGGFFVVFFGSITGNPPRVLLSGKTGAVQLCTRDVLQPFCSPAKC